MSQRTLQGALNWGEISPAFYGRSEMPQYRAGCSTLRNMFVSPRGGAVSRAGTAFVGQCLQGATASSIPPQLIPFSFNISQSYALEFGNLYMRVVADGSYVTETPIALSAVTQANPGVFSTTASHGLSVADWVFFPSVSGMTQLTGHTYVVSTVPSTTSFTLTPIFPGSAPLDTTAFGAFVSGSFARIYTLVTPYAIADVATIKYTQSADVMSLTHPLYAPYDLARITPASWTLTQTNFAASILPPLGVFAQPSSTTSTTVSTQYMYVVTAVDAITGEESIASQPGVVTNSVNIALTLGANTITWNPVTGASRYNLYKAPPAYGGPVPVGSLFGYLGTSYGLSFVDTNIVQDMAIVPPLHSNPFATSSIQFFTITATGSSYTTSTAPPQAIITDPTGSGATAYGIVVGTGTASGIFALILTDPGEGYTNPKVAVGTGGTGTGAVITTDPGNPLFLGDTIITNSGSSYLNPIITAIWSTGSLIATTVTVSSGHIVFAQFDISGLTKPVNDSDVTISVTDGSGSGATATASIGPSTGTWPSCVAYFDQRRFYGGTVNQPDTYWGSQPGAYTNFDSRVPVSDSDAISGTPWAQQVNGIQWMIPMPGGLVIMTGLGAWQLNGGSAGAALTPADQSAQAQGRAGVSPVIRPIPINYDILYVQQEGSIVRDLAYNLWTNIYAGTDVTLMSNHLFDNYTIARWDWAQERHKLVWVVRDDGILLSLAYLKEQNVLGWSRHDTQGLFQSVASISEPPIDAPYFIVKRYINSQWVYYTERMDNRLWPTIEDAWCLDCALALTQTEPAATIQASSATGGANVGSYLIIAAGTGYTAPVGLITDQNGNQVGATVTFGLTGGRITSATPNAQGAGATAPLTCTITDATGTGAVVQPQVTDYVTLSTDQGVFTAGNVGDVVRMGGGKLEVTAYTNSTSVQANVITPITAVIPNDPNLTPQPQGPGDWTITTPVSTVSGLNHLEGTAVSALADGGVVDGLTVTNGAVTLPSAASAIVVGLPFPVQMQTLYLESPPGAPPSQGRRKQAFEVVLRVQDSRAPEVGSNQPDAANQPNQATVEWSNMSQVPPRNPSIPPGTAEPLFTGDLFSNLFANWDDNAQVAIQQLDPVPLTILALVPSQAVGDT